jgi:hypothetical protein
MKIHALMIAAALTLVSAPALARHCPADMKKIDKALSEKPALSEKELAEVKKLRTEGEDLHKAGKHPESEAKLAKAMKILKIDEKSKK